MEGKRTLTDRSVIRGSLRDAHSRVFSLVPKDHCRVSTQPEIRRGPHHRKRQTMSEVTNARRTACGPVERFA